MIDLRFNMQRSTNQECARAPVSAGLGCIRNERRGQKQFGQKSSRTFIAISGCKDKLIQEYLQKSLSTAGRFADRTHLLSSLHDLPPLETRDRKAKFAVKRHFKMRDLEYEVSPGVKLQRGRRSDRRREDSHELYTDRGISRNLHSRVGGLRDRQAGYHNRRHQFAEIAGHRQCGSDAYSEGDYGGSRQVRQWMVSNLLEWTRRLRHRSESRHGNCAKGGARAHGRG
jgi:hypothetical protein